LKYVKNFSLGFTKLFALYFYSQITLFFIYRKAFKEVSLCAQSLQWQNGIWEKNKIPATHDTRYHLFWFQGCVLVFGTKLGDINSYQSKTLYTDQLNLSRQIWHHRVKKSRSHLVWCINFYLLITVCVWEISYKLDIKLIYSI